MRATLAWGGNVNLGRRQHYLTRLIAPERPLQAPALDAADLRIVNLKCVVAANGEAVRAKDVHGPSYCRARPEMLRILTDAGIDIVATATDCSGAYGAAALQEQAWWLDAIGIGHAGCAATLDASLAPAIRAAGGLNVAVFSVDATSPRFAATGRQGGNAYLPADDLRAWRETFTPRLAAARRLAHVVLVAVHWNTRTSGSPAQSASALGRLLIEAGADAVLGCGGETVQGVELHQGRPILHDAGDLLSDTAVRKDASGGGVFHLVVTPDGVQQIRFHPMDIGQGHSRRASGNRAAAMVASFAQRCAQFGTDVLPDADGSGRIDLPAPSHARPRPDMAAGTAGTTRYALSVLERTSRTVPTRCSVAQVPREAAIAPMALGPLTLLGVRISPGALGGPEWLWVESYWRADAPMDKDLRLDIRAEPTRRGRRWGAGMDHDPCDWMLPTSRWVPGTIYRDCVGLPPPPDNLLCDGELRLHVALAGAGVPVAAITPPIPPVPIRLAPKAAPHLAPVPAAIGDPDMTWTAEELCGIVGGTWITPPPPGWGVRSILPGTHALGRRPAPAMLAAHSSEDRSRHEGSILARPHWDFHDRLPRLARHLAGAMVSRMVPDLPRGFPQLWVPDPLKAAMELGLAARRRFQRDVVAIAGTAGKTTTAAMIQHLLAEQNQPCVATVQNHDSRVGAQVTLASLPRSARAAILEIGQSALWRREGPVTREVHPTIAVIPHLGLTHLARVRSIRDTAHWTSRVFQGLRGNGTAILGDHLPCFDELLRTANRHAARTLTYGTRPHAAFRLLDVKETPAGTRILLRPPQGRTLALQLPARSPGLVHSALCALVAAYAMGLELPRTASAMASLRPQGDGLRHTSLDGDGRHVDVYEDDGTGFNSLLHALERLAGIPAGGARKIAVLGCLSPGGEWLARLADPLRRAGIGYVATYGDEMQALRARLPASLLGPHFDAGSALADHLAEMLADQDIVLIKGPRGQTDFCGILPRLKQRLEERPADEATTQYALMDVGG